MKLSEDADDGFAAKVYFELFEESPKMRFDGIEGDVEFGGDSVFRGIVE